MTLSNYAFVADISIVKSGLVRPTSSKNASEVLNPGENFRWRTLNMIRACKLAAIVPCVVLSISCSRSSANLSSPSTAVPAGLIGVNPDGSSLKVSAPGQQSPVNGFRFGQLAPVVLVVTNSTGSYATGIPLTYQFEVLTPSGAVVYTSPLVPPGGGSTTSHTVAIQLEGDAPFQWQARPVYQGITGPVTGRASFFAPPTDGCIKDNELYDPLINGKTVGEIHGAVKFIPNVGIQMIDSKSYVQYQLQKTLVDGEYSGIYTNLSVISHDEDPKWRIMTMREGNAAINDNIYRMSVDKRGNGAVAWRFVSGNNSGGEYIETIGAEREVQAFHETLDYFVQATWRGGFFNVLFKENGFNGTSLYNRGKFYDGLYQPLPHMVFIGSPYAAGDRG